MNNPSVSGTSNVETLTSGDNYTWYLGAASTNGAAIAWSYQTFSLAAATATTLAQPTQKGPSGTIAAGAGFDTPTVSWSSVPGAADYYLFVQDTTTGAAAINIPSISGTSYTPSTSQALTPGHSYTWYIGATASSGAVSWSWESFTLAALAAPTQSGPSGTIAAGAGFDTPTFSWSSIPGAAQYYLYVVDDNTGQVPINNPSVTGASYTPSASQALTPGHRFTWYVAAESTNGAVLSWSGPTSFTLAALTAPTPINPSGFVSAASVSTTPSFSWSSVPGANHYYLYLVDANTGEVLINNADVTGTTYTTAPTLTVGDSYIWYIAAESTNNIDVLFSGPNEFTLNP